MKCGLKESHNTTQADDRSKRDGISAIWSQDMSLECNLQHVGVCVCDKYKLISFTSSSSQTLMLALKKAAYFLCNPCENNTRPAYILFILK